MIDDILSANATDHVIHTSAILIFFGVYFAIKTANMVKKSKKKRILKKNRSIEKIKKLSWEEFEHLCAEVFEAQGWNAKGNSKKGSDGGIDIWLTKRRESAIVQCKHYGSSSTRVTVKVLREMWGLRFDKEVDKVYVVTSSIFTRECYKFIHNKNIELINGAALVKLVNSI